MDMPLRRLSRQKCEPIDGRTDSRLLDPPAWCLTLANEQRCLRHFETNLHGRRKPCVWMDVGCRAGEADACNVTRVAPKDDGPAPPAPPAASSALPVLILLGACALAAFIAVVRRRSGQKRAVGGADELSDEEELEFGTVAEDDDLVAAEVAALAALAAENLAAAAAEVDDDADSALDFGDGEEEEVAPLPPSAEEEEVAETEPAEAEPLEPTLLDVAAEAEPTLLVPEEAVDASQHRVSRLAATDEEAELPSGLEPAGLESRRRLAAGLVPLAGASAPEAATRTAADQPAPDGGDELFDLRMGDAVQVADRNRRLRQQAEVEHARKLQEREEAEASRARAADHRRTLANVELEAPSHDRPDMFGHSSEVKEAALADSGSSHALGGAPTRLPDERKETVIEFENDTGRGMVLD